MNREIKFRAWDNENKYMITSKQGIFTALRNSMNITIQDNGYYNNGDLLKPNKEKYTLMQYTGLKDKNGVEIYEGDLILIGEKRRKVEVIFKDGSFGYLYNDVCVPFQYQSPEVIGNIYENEVD